MNYLAHGRPFAHDPYFLAGTAVPDWLNVVNRRVRVRAKAAVPFIHDAQPQVAAVARGIVQHHFDDAWFHRTAAFLELSTRLTLEIVQSFPSDTGPRAGFLGHILVELLLDAALIESDSTALAAYYGALATVSPSVVNGAVNRMASQATELLAPLIPRFSAERFLYDYTENAKLLGRLNAVLKRVKLAPLPGEFETFLAHARALVYERRVELLTAP